MEMMNAMNTFLSNLEVLARFATWSLLVWVALRCLEVVLCKVSVQEPPVVRSRVPILGQALKLYTQGVAYYENLRKQTNLPILTTFFGTQKVYVVNSPELITQINRQGKKIDGTLPFVQVIFGKFFGIHGDDLDGLMRNATAKNSLRHDLRTMEHAAVEAGTESLAEIYGNIFRDLADLLNDTASKGPERVNLLDWLRRSFTLATGRSIFGRGNPLDRSEDLVSCLWTMESGLKQLTMLPYQSVTARKAFLARERLVQAFINDNGPEGPVGLGRGSIALSQMFSDVSQSHNTGVEFQARYTLAFLTGFVINAVPALFWIVSLLAANKGLADRIRSEVQQVVTAIGSEEITVEAASLRSQCQLLLSTCREVLRHISSSIGTFLVNDDVHLDDGLVLKKGAVIQMAATAIHSNTAVWGTSANELDPERFLRREKVHPAANRVFGGGSSMCPGRHLAMDELLTFTAMFVHTFEVDLLLDTPRIPEHERNAMLSVKKPSSDLLVQVKRRADANCSRWIFTAAV